MNERLSIEIAELKLMKAEQQGGICPRCMDPLPAGAQLAHKIGQGSRNISYYERKYSLEYGKGIGEKIIQHPLNQDLTCPGPCNDRTELGCKIVEVLELVKKILEDIRNG